MFQPKTLKIVSCIALACCILGTVLDIFIIYTTPEIRAYLGLLSWTMLIYASFLGIKLSGYEMMYEEDTRRLGYYIYGILILFMLFMLFNFSIGVIAAFYLTYTLHNQKRGLDTWLNEQKQTDTAEI